ncbi:MAG: hypothetical protein DI555_12760 [Novosphingobium pentaromativorans]|uniref:Uncharacterized protein n=1 Tax=Novosphingobium pentaromativorans TaxID=205844 RepID=A0A2W5NQD5_9SPHN|nr:MAG: hypothetical protein DI555_12760 [Novosphingobium pentaromativorans]
MLAVSAMVAAVIAPAALADTPRELLTTAAFQAPDKKKALALIGQAIAESDRILVARPGDHEATLQRAIVVGYRAKLTRSRTDARASLAVFQRLAAQNPRDAEAQMVIAGWHLDAIDQLGGLVARTVLGAKAEAGEAALSRALTLGGNRAFYPGLAALMRIRKDEGEVAQARRLAETAAAAPAPTALDAQMKRAALSILPSLRANDGKSAARLSRKLLPFGKIAD